jgi:hypothetical protein
MGPSDHRAIVPLRRGPAETAPAARIAGIATDD